MPPTTKRDLSFLGGGMLFVGFWVLLVAMVANIFLQMSAPEPGPVRHVHALLLRRHPAHHPADRARRRTNYISATVTLYVSIYNIFLSLLSLLGGNRN